MEILYAEFPTNLCVSLAKVKIIQWVRLLIIALTKITQHFGAVCICKPPVVMLGKTEVNQQQQDSRKAFLSLSTECVSVLN